MAKRIYNAILNRDSDGSFRVELETRHGKLEVGQEIVVVPNLAQHTANGSLYRVRILSVSKPRRRTVDVGYIDDYDPRADFGGIVHTGKEVVEYRSYDCEIVGYEVEEGYTGGYARHEWGLLTTAQAATILGVNEQRIRQLCAEGRMGHKVGRDWVISPEDIERNRIRKPGRPKHERRSQD